MTIPNDRFSCFPFLSLPTELILQIIGILPPSSLRSLRCVSMDLYILATPPLYVAATPTYATRRSTIYCELLCHPHLLVHLRSLHFQGLTYYTGEDRDISHTICANIDTERFDKICAQTAMVGAKDQVHTISLSQRHLIPLARALIMRQFCALRRLDIGIYDNPIFTDPRDCVPLVPPGTEDTSAYLPTHEVDRMSPWFKYLAGICTQLHHLTLRLRTEAISPFPEAHCGAHVNGEGNGVFVSSPDETVSPRQTRAASQSGLTESIPVLVSSESARIFETERLNRYSSFCRSLSILLGCCQQLRCLELRMVYTHRRQRREARQARMRRVARIIARRRLRANGLLNDEDGSNDVADGVDMNEFEDEELYDLVESEYINRVSPGDARFFANYQEDEDGNEDGDEDHDMDLDVTAFNDMNILGTPNDNGNGNASSSLNSDANDIDEDDPILTRAELESRLLFTAAVTNTILQATPATNLPFNTAYFCDDPSQHELYQEEAWLRRGKSGGALDLDRISGAEYVKIPFLKEVRLHGLVVDGFEHLGGFVKENMDSLGSGGGKVEVRDLKVVKRWDKACFNMDVEDGGKEVPIEGGNQAEIVVRSFEKVGLGLLLKSVKANGNVYAM